MRNVMRAIQSTTILVCCLVLGSTAALAQVTQHATDTPVWDIEPTSSIDFALSGTVDSVEAEIALTVAGGDDVTLTGPGGASVVLVDFLYKPMQGDVYAYVLQTAPQSCANLCVSGCGTAGAPVICSPSQGNLGTGFDGQLSDSASWVLSPGSHIPKRHGIDQIGILDFAVTLHITGLIFADSFDSGGTSYWSN